MAAWPRKAHVYESSHFDSGAWSVVDEREGDIVIATAYKAGTTWMQTIVAQLVFKGVEPPASVGELSPWVDLRIPPRDVKAAMINGQTGRRFLKTHLPTDALDYRPGARYIYVARDGRDAFMSLLNHYKNGNEQWYEAINGAPDMVGPPIPTFDEVVGGSGDPEASARAFFDKWLSTGWDSLPWEEDGYPFWSLFRNVASWWQVRELPNVLLVHFNDLKADLAGEMRRVAAFIGEPVQDEALFQRQVAACTFEAMKANAASVAPLGGVLWKGGAETFIHKGTNGRWKGVLTDEQVKAYLEKASAKLGGACALWLENGGKVPGERGFPLSRVPRVGPVPCNIM